MNKNINEVKYQTCNISNALLRNINDNFISVSFDFEGNNYLVVKVVLVKRTEKEDGYIEDMIAEFSALQESDSVRKVLVEVGVEHFPLQNLVYQKSLE